jgi:hypothetical protein
MPKLTSDAPLQQQLLRLPVKRRSSFALPGDDRRKVLVDAGRGGCVRSDDDDEPMVAPPPHTGAAAMLAGASAALAAAAVASSSEAAAAGETGATSVSADACDCDESEASGFCAEDEAEELSIDDAISLQDVEATALVRLQSFAAYLR